jgi:hypothetical protein
MIPTASHQVLEVSAIETIRISISKMEHIKRHEFRMMSNLTIRGFNYSGSKKI